jgi:serine protease inhibitor
MKTFKTIAIMTAAIALTACSNDEPSKSDENRTTPYRQLQLNERTRGAVDANNNFAFDLFRQVSEKQGNFIVSPYGFFSALSMLANGDNGDTRDAILKGLGYTDGTEGLSALNEYCGMMNRELPELDGRVNLSLANSIWTAAELNENFSNELSDTFNAEWIAQNPAGESGMQAINNWVSDNTKGMIARFLKQPQHTSLSVINAIYFNGKWTNKFSKSETKSGLFKNIDGTEAKADFMNQTADFLGYFYDNIEAVELTYGSGNYSMLLIKPTEGKTFDEMRNSIDQDYLDNMMASPVYLTYNLQVSVPKFKIYTDLDLAGAIGKMGFEDIFTREFNSILKNNSHLNVSSLLQAVTIDVNEEGTEAASATQAGMTTAPAIFPHAPVVFNSPFIYMIRERSTNTVFFIGQVVNF